MDIKVKEVESCIPGTILKITAPNEDWDWIKDGKSRRPGSFCVYEDIKSIMNAMYTKAYCNARKIDGWLAFWLDLMNSWVRHHKNIYDRSAPPKVWLDLFLDFNTGEYVLRLLHLALDNNRYYTGRVVTELLRGRNTKVFTNRALQNALLRKNLRIKGMYRWPEINRLIGVFS